MKKMFASFVILSLVFVSIGFSQMGKQILSLDGSASKWSTGKQVEANKFVLSDESDDKVEGNGSLKVDVALRAMGASWGTWTDANYTFPAPINISGADDIRFRMKIIQKPSTSIAGKPPSFSKALQFTFDLNDSSSAGTDLWRYNEDLDIFYTAHRWASAQDSADGWWEFIIPIKSLRFPSWAPSTDGVVNLEKIKSIAFGVHGDSTATDSVTFLIDDIRATKASSVGQILSLDGSASKWALDKQVATNLFALTDESDDKVEGNGSLKVNVALRTMGASWGTWTDASYTLNPPVNVEGATELRFSMKVLSPTVNKKGVQFTLDIKDTSGFFFRWVNGGYYGLFIRKNDNPTVNDGWFEVVVPLNDMLAPSWNPPKYPGPLLKTISGIGFGLHNDSTKADSVTILLDNVIATKAGNLTSVRRDELAGALSGFDLSQNYPNPFNPSTSIKYSLDQTGIVSLRVFNLLGQEVRTVVDNVVQEAGPYRVTINMSGLSSGVYLYQLKQGGMQISKKMMLIQ